MEDEVKGLLDALHDQIAERDALRVKVDHTHDKIKELSSRLDHELCKLAPNRKGWVLAFTALIDEGDYVSASKLASVALEDFLITPNGPLRTEWVLHHEMARRLLDESKKAAKPYHPGTGKAYKC